MRIKIKVDGNQYEFDVNTNNNISEIKKQLSYRLYNHNFMDFHFIFNGDVMKDDKTLGYYNISVFDLIIAKVKSINNTNAENSNYSTNIDCQNKRGLNGNVYCYKIKGSNEGQVWGDGVYSDDSNIAKAAVMEGKCKLGEEMAICIQIIKGQSSYSSCNRNGISSCSWGSWDGSYIFY